MFQPTGRLPCPAVVSRTVLIVRVPKSIEGPWVEFDPTVGIELPPQCVAASRILFVPGEPSSTFTSVRVWLFSSST